ncbi:MAG: enoyl-CoA hydratase/isomerase family protein [Parvibaculales bacterium]
MTENDTKPVLASIENGLGLLLLNRPKALHSLDQEMCQLMLEALLGWKDDAQVKAIWIAHLPETRGFCAGGDIRLLSESGRSDGKAAQGFFRLEYQLNHLLHSYEAQFGKPVIAVMDGITMGGGVGISVHGRYRVATENTVFAMPETGIGLFPDVGGGWFLPRLAGELGAWLAMTGARLKTADCLKAGIATHFTASEKLADLRNDITAALSAISAGDGAATLAAIDAVLPHDVAAAGEVKTLTSQTLAEIDELFAGDNAEAIEQRLAAANTEFALQQHADLKTKSPLTVKLALKQIRRGAKMACFADNMVMEYRIGCRAVMHSEFHEGVRAVITDKDNAPQWQHENLAQVGDDFIESYFMPLEGVDEWTPRPEVSD